MTVSRLTAAGDWTFGSGQANYMVGSAEIAQNVMTRIKSVAGDYYLDIDAEIDWDTLLGLRDNQNEVVNELARVTLATSGVARIDEIEIISNDERAGVFRIKYTDVLGVENELEAQI